LVKYTHLPEFWEFFCRVINLSGIDTIGMPTVTALNWMQGTLNFDENEFYKCVEFSLLEIKRDIKLKTKKPPK